MSDVAGLEGRLAAALERIRYRVEMMEAQSAVGGGSAEMDALKSQLEDERTANAQLQERVKTLSERNDAASEPLEAQMAVQAGNVAALDEELQKLRASNAELLDLSGQLRSAATEGAADAELINRAMMAEVDALKAQQSATAAELATILSELKPIVEGA